jgi:DNA modification methylase
MTKYNTILPIESAVAADRQGAKRHYGVHPYFTRRPYNVVRKYILNYSKERDVVLDPFGGSGVTPIEAFLENRSGIQNDINPLANFIARGIAELRLGNVEDYKKSLAILKEQCQKRLGDLSNLNEMQLRRLRQEFSLPENVRLPSNSDVSRYHELFSHRQLIALVILRNAIDSIPNRHARAGMLLAWSATLTKLNKTFLSAEDRAESRGGSSIFSIYRYKIAKTPIELAPWQTFYERANNIITAKLEIDAHIEYKKRTGGFAGQFKVYSRDIQSLSEELEGQVDYIFTDPPYGGHISYLDLSTLWNSWICQIPNLAVRKNELIVGGELGLTEANYVERLGKSIEACMRMLKKGRWLSVVFQHWNTAYFEAILSAAAATGGELRAAVSQIGDPIWSMHKKKRNQSVLAGELIITFFKTGKVKKLSEPTVDFDVSAAVGKVLSEAQSSQIYGEYLFNRVVMEAWKQSAIGALSITKMDFIELIKHHGWHYDESRYYWVRNKVTANPSLFETSAA